MRQNLDLVWKTAGTLQQPEAGAALDDNPQSLRQQQHEQAETSGQADLQIRFADVGCGFGGLLVRLSPLYPRHVKQQHITSLT